MIAAILLSALGSASVEPSYIDVAKQFGARGDGVTDDTGAIQRALNEYTGKGRVLYLRAGTYLVSDALAYRKGEGIYGFTHLWGAGPAKTVIRLRDAQWTDPEHRRALLTLGSHGSADWFHNTVQNLTLDTGKGNPGASGIEFYSNNTGALRHVGVRSGDGQGRVGVELGHGDMNGPLLVQHVRIEGFATGVHAGYTVNSQTLEHVQIVGAQVGLKNEGQCLAVRGLQVQASGPAIQNLGGNSFLTLLESDLSGKGPIAIENTGYLMAQNVAVKGYRDAARAGDGGGNSPLRNFTTHEFGGMGKTVRVAEPPTVSNQLRAVRVADFGAVPNDGKDDTVAIQRALNSSAPQVILGGGQYNLSQTLTVPITVRRIAGGMASLEFAPAMTEIAQPCIRMVGKGQPLTIDSLSTGYGGGKLWLFQNDADRTVVLRDLQTNLWFGTYRNTGTGDLFIENVVGGNWIFTRQRVWARQFNAENEGTKMVNEGGQLWILGLKTERGGTLVKTTGGGQTTVMGGMSYTTTAGKLAPMFVLDRGTLGLSFAETCYSGDPFATFLRAGSRTVLPAALPSRANGVAVPWFWTAMP